MHDQLLFWSNVIAHWVASMSGFGALVFAIVEYIKKRKPEAVAFCILGAVLLVVAFDQAWQDEHRNSSVLIAQKFDLAKQVGFWKAQSYQNGASLAGAEATLTANIGALAGAQQSANAAQISLAKLAGKVLELDKPITRKLTLVAFDGDNSVNPKKLRWLMLTNVDVPSPRILFVCDSPIVEYGVNPMEGIAVHGAAGRLAPNAFEMDFSSPAWTPTAPFIASVQWEGKKQLACAVQAK